MKLDKYAKKFMKHIMNNKKHNFNELKKWSKKTNNPKIKKLYKLMSKNKKKQQVLLFHNPSCKYCKEFYPLWNELKEEYNDSVSFISINSDNYSDLINLPKYEITGFPTLIFESNYIPYKYEGDRVRSEIINWFEPNLYGSKPQSDGSELLQKEQINKY